MEQVVVKLLDYNIVIPTRFTPVSRFALAANLTKKERAFLSYLLEISLQDVSLDTELVSKVTAAALHLVLQYMRPLDEVIWTKALVHYTSYEEVAIAPLIYKLRSVHACVDDHTYYKNMLKKYDTSAQFHVARTMCMRIEDMRFTSEMCVGNHRVLIAQLKQQSSNKVSIASTMHAQGNQQLREK